MSLVKRFGCLVKTIFIVHAAILCAQQPSLSKIKPKLSEETVSQLLQDLATVDSQSIGLDSSAIYDGFIADGASGDFRLGVLGVAAPKISPQMRELVRRGPLALADIVAHIDDKTPTKLTVGNIEDGKPREIGVNTFMFTYFSNEYDPRFRAPKRIERPHHAEKMFTGGYAVKLGDVCFALIGQIVNRHLLAVRYQPSAGLVVNSPLEFPELAEQVKKDWSNIDLQGLKSSLLADISGQNRLADTDAAFDQTETVFPALERLRFYFPDSYRDLGTSEPTLIKAFEKAKRKRFR